MKNYRKRQRTLIKNNFFSRWRVWSSTPVYKRDALSKLGDVCRSSVLRYLLFNNLERSFFRICNCHKVPGCFARWKKACCCTKSRRNVLPSIFCKLLLITALLKYAKYIYVRYVNPVKHSNSLNLSTLPLATCIFWLSQAGGGRSPDFHAFAWTVMDWYIRGRFFGPAQVDVIPVSYKYQKMYCTIRSQNLRNFCRIRQP